MEIVPLIKIFFETLNSRQIEYCHWKSNHSIKSFLQGKGDLDILVPETSEKEFKKALSEYNFKLVVCPSWEQTDFVYHYYGLDEDTGKTVHLHVYFKLMTGGMLIKNYHLPLAELLLESSKESDGIKIPDRSSEFLLFVIRKIIECGSLPDFLFTLREAENINKEFKWLFDSNASNKAKALLPRYLPEFDPDLFDECIQTLHSRPHYFRWVSLSKKLHKVFSSYAINPPLKNKWLTWKKFFHIIYQKFISGKQVYDFFDGGALIAFVGADASGKSTHITKTENWLSKMVFVEKIHSGKPPSSFLTFPLRLFLPIFRKLIPNQRINFIELKRNSDKPQENRMINYSIIYLVRSIMIAFDQRKLLKKARHMANKGAVVICDRYPSAALGGMDGRRVDPSFFDKNEPFKRFLAGIEKRIYNTIPKPDLAFKLSVPFDVNLKRFSERNEEMDGEPKEQIQCRREVMDKWELPGVLVHEIDNSNSLEMVQNRIKSLIWKSL
jgi:thymidylate kinase